MKTTALFLLLLSSIIWACTKAHPSKQSPAAKQVSEPDPLEKTEPDPLRLQFKRFGYDVQTGKYQDYPAYRSNTNGC